MIELRKHNAKLANKLRNSTFVEEIGLLKLIARLTAL